MATAAVLPHISVEEYLHSSYEPDVDYVDGNLEERNVGENEHSNLQAELITILRNHRAEWNVKTFPEQRVQVQETRYRVPDVCVMPGSWSNTPIVREAPLLCIEVLSPEDRFTRVLTKCREYLTMGVRSVWILDPAERAAFVLHTDGKVSEQRQGTLQLEGTAIAIDLADLFAVLDEG